MDKVKPNSEPYTLDAPSTFGGRRPSSCSVMVLLFALLLTQCTTEYPKINGHTPCASQTCGGGGSECSCTKSKNRACFCAP